MTLSEGWEYKKWESVLEIRSGRSQKQVVNPNGKYPIYGSGGIMGYADNYICDEGTTIIGRKGTINNPIYVETKFWNVDTAFGLSPSECLNSKFLYYFCLSYDFTKRDKGTTLPSLVKKDLINLSMPIPPLEVQKRIVDILDEAFEGIDKAIALSKQNLLNARELFDSYLNNIFTNKGDDWVEKKLGDVCQFENGDRGKNYPNREEYVDSGIPWINTGHIKLDGTLSKSKMNYITQEKYESLRSGKIKQGDLVYCLRGATLGKTALVEPFEIGAVASSLVIIRPKKLLDSYFLYFFLKSHIVQRFIKLYVNGAAQPNLGANSVAQYIISFPSIKEQKAIVQTLKNIDNEVKRLEELYQKKVALLEDLKQSILERAFRGELTANK